MKREVFITLLLLLGAAVSPACRAQERRQKTRLATVSPPGRAPAATRRTSTVQADTETANTAPTATATSTRAATATVETTATRVAMATNTATLTPEAAAVLTRTPLTPVDVEQAFPLPWPVPPFRDAQIEAAKRCSATIASGEATFDLGERQSACEWTSLAAAYIRERVAEGLQTATPESGPAARSFHLSADLPSEAVYSFGQAVAANPALALVGSYKSPPLYAAYLNALPLVEPPPLVQQPITGVDISLEQIDHVPSVQYALHIEGANGNPAISGQITRWDYGDDGETVSTEEITGAVGVDRLQRLGGEGLSDLLPIDRSFRMGPGIGYTVNWQVTLTFADGSTLAPFNSGTMLFAGAPWFVELDGQLYMQYSTDFLDALLGVTGALALPPGNDPALVRHVHWYDSAQPLEAGFNR